HLFRHNRWTSVRIVRCRRQLGSDRAGFAGRIVGGSSDADSVKNKIRVVLTQHLRTLAKVNGEIAVEVEGRATQRTDLVVHTTCYPMLRGTIRYHATRQRRPFLRYFACEEDLTHESPDAPLPDAVQNGAEPFLIIGAIAGGRS